MMAAAPRFARTPGSQGLRVCKDSGFARTWQGVSLRREGNHHGGKRGECAKERAETSDSGGCSHALGRVGRVPAGWRRRLYRGQQRDVECRGWRVRRHCRTDRLRQVDAAQYHRGPARACGRARGNLRRAAVRPQPAGRLFVSGRRVVPVEDRAGERRHRAGDGRRRRRARRARARKHGSSAWAWVRSAIVIRTCCRAASASVSVWRRC